MVLKGSRNGMYVISPKKNLDSPRTFLDPMLLRIGLRGFLAYEKCKFYKQVPNNKILPYFMSTLSQLLKVWTHEIKKLN